MAWLQFIVSAVLIIIAGARLTGSAEALGKNWGLGSGWAGVLLLPLATSLPELVTSLRAAAIQAPDLAVGNLLGSNLFNIAIIALVDILQGKGSLLYRVRQGHILAASLGIVLMVVVALGIILPFPTIGVGWFGLDTLIICGSYLFAARLLTTYEKQHLSPEDVQFRQLSTRRAVIHFLLAALVILAAGITLTDAADVIALETGLGRTFVGSIMLAAATSLPEVVTTTTAVRLGKLDMALGNIFGANIFNMFILFIVDVFYVDGFLLQDIAIDHLLTILMGILLTGVAIAGLIYRSQKSVGWIGFDALIIAGGYLIAFALLFFRG